MSLSYKQLKERLQITMFYTDPYSIQRGRGIFNVDKYSLQRGRGLGGIFASLLKKVIPFGKSFIKHAASSGKRFIKSDLGKDILNDTIASAATAATSALLDQDPNEAKTIIRESLKRTGNKSKSVVKRIARDKLDQVLTGKGKKRRGSRKDEHPLSKQKKKITLLDL